MAIQECMADFTLARERDGDAVVFRLAGVLDREAGWALREEVERDATREIVLDFTLVRDLSDLGVAVLAHGLAGAERVLLRGLRQRELRIFRCCGVPIEELSARDAAAPAPG